MANDYISRQAAIDLWDKYRFTIAVDAIEYGMQLKRLLAADVAQVVHGRWIEDEGEGYHGIHCSRCNFSIPYGNVMMGYNFCPKCGAKMDKR